MFDTVKGIAEFNPKGIPDRITGKCQNEDHESWTGEKLYDEELRLIMFYSDEYNDKWLDRDTSKMSGEEMDELYEKYEQVKWKPDSEAYWCESCVESFD